MFECFGMMDNYEDRKVDRFEEGELWVDTCAVNDSSHEYETAVTHPEYNDGEMVIVEQYDTKKDAQAGHNKWVKKLTSKKLPAKLIDVSDCDEAIIGYGPLGSPERIFKRNKQ